MHSVEVTQVPVRLEEVVHASLGNWTTENRPMGLGAEELRPMATTSIMIEMKELASKKRQYFRFRHFDFEF